MKGGQDQRITLLEIRSRQGSVSLRAVGATAIAAAVAIHLSKWAAILLLAQLGWP
jgi:hypothetical protein